MCPQQQLIEHLKFVLAQESQLDFSVLVGSQATKTATDLSDWDIAIQWPYAMSFEQQLTRTEKLRHTLAQALHTSDDNVDLINAPTAQLAMKARIANEGLELSGIEALPWRHFLQRTWRELEEYDWDELYSVSTMFDLYLKETAVLANQYQKRLQQVTLRLQQNHPLSDLEAAGVIHTLQILIENAIGKAKQLLKYHSQPVPTSAYDAMTALADIDQLAPEQLDQWYAIIGLRNRIVHEYMNLDVKRVLEVVKQEKYRLVTTFLLAPMQDIEP
jgi:uncharacterized protein YutE (UPF0331/DUF86 family)